MASTRQSLGPLIIPSLTLTRQQLPSTSISLAPRFLFFHTTTTTTTTTPNHPLLRPAFSPLPPPPPPPSTFRRRYQKYKYKYEYKYSTSPSSPSPKPYTFEAVQSLLSRTPTPSSAQHNRTPPPSAHRTIIIDVREPAEVQSTGRIPGAYNMPLTSNPDAFYLGEEDFFERFGFEKPRRAIMVGGVRRVEEEEGRGTRAQESPFSGEAKKREAGSGLNAEDGKGEKVDDGADVDDEGVGDGKDGGGVEEEEKGVEEVVFYCKAGVRSRAAARMAREWVGIKIGDMQGGWMEWERKGGQIER